MVMPGIMEMTTARTQMPIMANRVILRMVSPGASGRIYFPKISTAMRELPAHRAEIFRRNITL